MTTPITPIEDCTPAQLRNAELLERDILLADGTVARLVHWWATGKKAHRCRIRYADGRHQSILKGDVVGLVRT